MSAAAGTLPGFRYPAPPMLTSMSALTSATQAAHVLLAEGTTPEKTHNGINPPLNGAIVFVVLLILLFVTTRLNKDR